MTGASQLDNEEYILGHPSNPLESALAMALDKNIPVDARIQWIDLLSQ
jgi:hypothetical protein